MKTLAEFFAMGGYGFYVWTAYAVAAIVLIINALIPSRRERALLKSLGERKPNKRSTL